MGLSFYGSGSCSTQDQPTIADELVASGDSDAVEAGSDQQSHVKGAQDDREASQDEVEEEAGADGDFNEEGGEDCEPFLLEDNDSDEEGRMVSQLKTRMRQTRAILWRWRN
jgi:hypothetical protein